MGKVIHPGVAWLLSIAGGVWLCARSGIAQTTTVSVPPSADAFLRSLAPASNYGGAGAWSISGSSALNATGQQNGLFDSLARFSMSGLVTSVDAALGTHDWLLTRVTLHVYEMGAPPSPIFNRGVGGFEIRWIANDNWVEGTGIPSAPTTNGVAYQDLPSILSPGLDATLGYFTNAGLDGPLSFNLGLLPALTSDIRSGTEVGLYFTAASPSIGFTVVSRSFVVPSELPILEVSAEVNPRPELDPIRFLGTNIAVSFNTVSNWTYVLQYAETLPFSGTAAWSNLLIMPAQPVSGHEVYLDSVTNRQRFYRLSVSP